MFDREMAVIQQAAQDAGYDLNSSWLPWKSEEARPLTHLVDVEYASDLVQEREACPGVILFRKHLSPDQTSKVAYDTALMVFVVGEQATGGINHDQWQNAIGWLSNTNPDTYEYRPASGRADDGVLRVLGPTFTGSLVSLERDIEHIYPGNAALTSRFPKARALSGSVTGCSSVHWFQRQVSNLTGRPIDFGTFQENDSVHIFRFLEFLNSQGIDLNDTAILSEDETVYGGGAAPPGSATEKSGAADPCDFPYAVDHRPLHLVYPRDISALRNAYEKQAVFDSSGGGLKEHQHPILHEEAKPTDSPSEVTDTIPSSSGTVAEIDQEAYLYGLVSFLRTHHTRYLMLRCTNPLDFLFLTRFFHRAYPEARMVTVGSDLLFRREIDTTEFRGVISLSSYPLLPRGQHWEMITTDKSDGQPHNHLIYPSHLVEGQYIAARYLLETDEAIEDQLEIEKDDAALNAENKKRSQTVKWLGRLLRTESSI